MVSEGETIQQVQEAAIRHFLQKRFELILANLWKSGLSDHHHFYSFFLVLDSDFKGKDCSELPWGDT